MLRFVLHYVDEFKSSVYYFTADSYSTAFVKMLAYLMRASPVICQYYSDQLKNMDVDKQTEYWELLEYGFEYSVEGDVIPLNSNMKNSIEDDIHPLKSNMQNPVKFIKAFYADIPYGEFVTEFNKLFYMMIESHPNSGEFTNYMEVRDEDMYI